MITFLAALLVLLLPSVALAIGPGAEQTIAVVSASAAPLYFGLTATTWMEIAAAYVFVTGVLNKVVPPGPDGQKPHWLRAMLDIASFIPMRGHSGLAGQVSLPGARSRKNKAPSAPPVVALAALVFLSPLLGCQAALDGAQRAKGDTMAAIQAAGQAWEKYDGEKLRQINTEEKYREDALRRIQEYAKGERAIAIRTFNAAAKAVEAIDHLLALGAAAKAKDIQAAVANAYSALAAVVDFLTSIGVKVPTGVL